MSRLKIVRYTLQILQAFASMPEHFLKFVSAIFCQIFIFHQTIALQKLWRMFFISSKKLFSFSRYLIFCVSIFPSFSPCLPLFNQDKS